MESIDRAIRGAFAKTEAHNPATRQRIYEAAWGAHERALAANTSLSEEQKQKRREKVKDTISRIEREYKMTPQPQPQAPQTPSIDPILGGVTASSRVASDHSDQGSSTKGRRRARNSEYDRGVSPRNRTAKRSPLIVRLGLPLLILLVLVIIGYSLFNSFANFNRNASTSPLHANSVMSPLREGEDPEGRKWIDIYTPQDATRMGVNGRAQARIMREGDQSFVRVESFGNNDTVTFEVGAGLLDQLAGKKATFDIVASSEATTQISVSCDFGSLGDCGRRRYDVNDSVSDFLFDIDMPSGQKPTGSGIITIHSDLSGNGKPVDIYAIRVAAAAE